MVKKGIRRTQAKQQFGGSLSESQAGIRKEEEIGANIKQTNKQTPNNREGRNDPARVPGDSFGPVLGQRQGALAEWLCGL